MLEAGAEAGFEIRLKLEPDSLKRTCSGNAVFFNTIPVVDTGKILSLSFFLQEQHPAAAGEAWGGSAAAA